MNIREEFEKWAVSYRDQHNLPHFVMKDSNGDYVDSLTTVAWVAWQAARESGPSWTTRLNSCKHHGDDHEACAVYGGRVPCDAEGGEAVAFIDPQSLLNFKNEKASLEWAWRCNDGDLIPLYTHPPAAKVPPKLEWRKRVSKWSVFLGGLKNAPIPEHQRNTAASIKKEIDRYLEHGVGHD